MKLNSKITAAILLTSLMITPMQTVFGQYFDVVPPGMSPQEDLPYPDMENIPAFNQKTNYQTAPLQGSVAIIPAGTTFEATTSATVGSTTNEVGDLFTATLTSPITANGSVIIPEGSEATGQITYIDNAGRLGKNGVMEIRFTSIKPPYGAKVPIVGKIITVDNSGVLKGGSIKKQLVQSVATGAVATGGGTLAGLTVGGIVGSAGGGAIIGTTAGGIFGLGYIFARKGKEVTLPASTKMNIILEQPLTISR